MRIVLKYVISSLLIFGYALSQVVPNTNLRIHGYLVSWALDMTGLPGGAGAANYGNCPYTAIDYDACTDYIMFDAHFTSTGAMQINTEWDGGTTWGPNPTMVQKRKPLNDYIHSKGKTISMTMFVQGGGGSWTTLLSSAASRNAMIRTIVDSIIGSKYQYDGVHFDPEPVNGADTANARIFFAQLRDTLNKYHQWIDVSKKPLMTVAIYGSQLARFWGGVSVYFDAILHMSYNMFGSWESITWYNAPVYQTGYESASYNVQSIKNYTDFYVSSGIPRDKLVMACPFNYNAYKGGSTSGGEGCYAPLLTMTSFPTQVNTIEEMYYNCWNKYIDTATTTIHRDDIRKASWVGYNRPGSADDMLIIFQDTASIRANLEYLSSEGLQGAMVWEICGGFLSTRNVPDLSRHPGLARDHLLQAVKKTRYDLMGTQPPPEASLNISPASLSFGNIKVGSAKIMAYNLSATNLSPASGSITVSSSTGFKVSLDSSFNSSLSIPYSGGTLNTDINVQFQPLLPQSYYGNVTNSGSGLLPAYLFVSGDGLGDEAIVRLGQNFPNPFNSTTKIPYSIYKQSRVRLRIYDILGRIVATLVDEDKPAGYYEEIFIIPEKEGNKYLTSGIYIYTLEACGVTTVNKFLILK